MSDRVAISGYSVVVMRGGKSDCPRLRHREGLLAQGKELRLLVAAGVENAAEP